MKNFIASLIFLLCSAATAQAAETFDEAQWAKLVAEHRVFPCKNDFIKACLLENALLLMGIPNHPVRDSDILPLAKIAIDAGDRNTAKILLKQWPSETELAAMEIEAHKELEQERKRLGMMVMGKESENAAPNKVNIAEHFKYINYYPQLLFLSGNYEAAEKLIIDRQKKKKTGEDYGAIAALVAAGELDEALKVSNLTLKWEREGYGKVMAMTECVAFMNFRGEGMAQLATAFAETGQLEKAYETAQLLQTYWTNNGYGGDYCSLLAAKEGFGTVMTKLMRAYSTKGDKEKAADIALELQDAGIPSSQMNQWPPEEIADTKTLPGLATQLAKDERWEELEALWPKVILPLENISWLLNIMVGKADTERYKRFIDLVFTNPHKALLPDSPKAKEIPHYLWTITFPFMLAMNGKPVPESLLADMWTRYIDLCKSPDVYSIYYHRRIGSHLSDVKEEMANCYLGLVGKAAFYRKVGAGVDWW